MKLKQKGLISSLLLFSTTVGSGETSTSKVPTNYSPVGKRDPFRLPLTSQSRGVAAQTALERFNVEQLQLRAILRTDGRSRAMFEDPEGKTHICFEGDIIGRERAAISRILVSEVIVTQRTFNYLGQENLYEKVISLPASEESLTSQDATGVSQGGSLPKNGPSGIGGGQPGSVAGTLGAVGGIAKKLDDRAKELEKLINEGQGSPK